MAQRVFWRHNDEFGVGTLVLSYSSPALNHKRVNVIRPITPTSIDKLDYQNLNKALLEDEMIKANDGIKLHLDDCIIANWIYDLTPTLEGELKSLNNLVKVKDLNQPEEQFGTLTSTLSSSFATTISTNTLSALASYQTWKTPKKIKPPSNSR